MKKFFTFLAAALFSVSMSAGLFAETDSIIGSDSIPVLPDSIGPAYESFIFDFTDTIWGFPTAYDSTGTHMNADSVAITINATNGYKALTTGPDSARVVTGLIFGKKGSTLTLPAFDYAVSKIIVTGLPSASAKVTTNIFVGDSAVSTEITGAKEANTFAIAADKRAAGTVYVLKVTNDNNAQVSKIEVFADKGEIEPEPEPVVYDTLSATNAADSALAGNTSEVYVKGYVTEIASEFSAQYKNVSFWIADSLAGGKVFEVFRAVCEKEEDAPLVGDYVLAFGKLTDYYNKKDSTHTPEFAAGCTYEFLEKVPRPEPQPEEELVISDTLSVFKAIELGMALDSAATDTVVYAVEGYVVNPGAFSMLYYNQSWYMTDTVDGAAMNFQAYNCYPIEGKDTLKVLAGDKVYVVGKLKKYYNKSTGKYIIEIERGNAEFISKVDGDHSVIVKTEEINVAQALEIGAALGNNAVSEKMYKITGYVSAINVQPKDAYSDQYKNQSFWVSDDPNSSASTNADGAFYVYRGKPETEAEIPVGSKVEFTCTIKKYVKDTTTAPVVENADQNIVIKVLEAGHVDTLNVAEAVEVALALGDNEESKQVYVVIGNVAKIKDEYSEKYKNISFYMTDEAVDSTAFGDLQVYRGNISEAEGKALAAGDRVMVVGKLKNNFYNDKNSAQFATGAEVTVMWKQAIEQIVLTEKVNKVIMNGAVYIVRDGKLYDLRGAQVR